jgi:hypothetical protein
MDGRGGAIDLRDGYDVYFSGFTHRHSPATVLVMQEACQFNSPLKINDIPD